MEYINFLQSRIDDITEELELIAEYNERGTACDRYCELAECLDGFREELNRARAGGDK